MSVSPLLNDGVAGRRERLLLTAVLLAPIFFVFLSGTATLVAGFVMSVGLLAWLLRGRTLYLHGAEHRAIAAAEEGNLGATWEGDAKPSRFSLRCGTNFVALVLPVGLVADQLWPFAPALWTPVVVAVLSLALSMELWRAPIVPGLASAPRCSRAPSAGLDGSRYRDRPGRRWSAETAAKPPSRDALHLRARRRPSVRTATGSRMRLARDTWRSSCSRPSDHNVDARREVPHVDRSARDPRHLELARARRADPVDRAARRREAAEIADRRRCRDSELQVKGLVLATVPKRRA